MNNKKHLWSLLTAIVIALLGIFPAVLVFADSDNRGVSVDTSLHTPVEAGDHVGSSVKAASSADVKESDSMEMDSEDFQDHTAQTTMHREDSWHNSNDQGDDGEDNKDKISVDHEDGLQATTTIKTSNEVHDEGELRSFLNHVVKEDDRIAHVEVSSTSVETDYSLPARLLWAIPTNISAQVSIGTDGSVTITYPWYAFLFARHDEALKTQLTQSARSAVNAGASTTFSASIQAHLLNLILSVLKRD